MPAQITLKVDPDVLRSTSHEVTSLVSALSNDFDQLQRLVSRTRYYWIGAAGDQYRKEFAASERETQELLDLLKKYPSDLMAMAQIYDRSESGTTQAVGVLPSHIIS